jgi:hypothetical protein
LEGDVRSYTSQSLGYGGWISTIETVLSVGRRIGDAEWRRIEGLEESIGSCTSFGKRSGGLREGISLIDVDFKVSTHSIAKVDDVTGMSVDGREGDVSSIQLVCDESHLGKIEDQKTWAKEEILSQSISQWKRVISVGCIAYTDEKCE